MLLLRWMGHLQTQVGQTCELHCSPPSVYVVFITLSQLDLAKQCESDGGIGGDSVILEVCSKLWRVCESCMTVGGACLRHPLLADACIALLHLSLTTVHGTPALNPPSSPPLTHTSTS